MILMLDFDGVLHPDPCYDEALLFSKLPIVEAALRSAPSANVVISSTWKNKRNMTRLQALFSPDIAQRIIDVTPEREDFYDLAESIGPTYLRQIEIEAWLRINNRAWEPWVALDDKRHWFRPFEKNLILCDPSTGITEDQGILLQERLASQ